MSTIGNKVFYLLHSSDRSPAWHPSFRLYRHGYDLRAASFSDGKAAPPIEIPELGNAFAYGLLWRVPNGTSLTSFSLADLNGRLL